MRRKPGHRCHCVAASRSPTLTAGPSLALMTKGRHWQQRQSRIGLRLRLQWQLPTRCHSRYCRHRFLRGGPEHCWGRYQRPCCNAAYEARYHAASLLMHPKVLMAQMNLVKCLVECSRFPLHSVPQVACPVCGYDRSSKSPLVKVLCLSQAGHAADLLLCCSRGPVNFGPVIDVLV